MLVNSERVDQFVESRGAIRNLSAQDWGELISLVAHAFDRDIYYKFCLLPQTRVPQKEVYAGFPAKIAGNLEHLNLLELFMVDSGERQVVTEFLDSRACPWENLEQFDPDTGTDEPIGVRILGFTFATITGEPHDES